ncbi:MAG: hypothetical protein ACXWQO_05235 [Bdellovibrionota bacterium]
MNYETNRTWLTVNGDKRALAIAGAEAGLVSGLVMLFAMMIYTASRGEGFLFPLREIAATFVGVEALIGGAGTLLLGTVIHFAVAAAWGAGFGLVLPPNGTALSAAGWGVVYSLGVWLVMSFIALPIFDPVMSDRVALYSGTWFTFHLLYGAALGVTPRIADQMVVRETYTESYRRAA